MDIKDYDLSGYSYGEIGDKIIDLCADYPPDFGKIIELMETGFDLNTLCDAEGYYENMLAKVFYGYPDIIGFREDVCEKCIDESCEGCSLNYPEADGRYLPHIVKLFLEHGFDCSRNNGRMGSVCLSYFIWSSRDKYILEAAKILLEAGANPEAISYEDSNDNALSMVATEESHVLCSDHEYELSNLYYTLYEIMDACVKKESFADIYNYDIAVGKRIDQIVLYGPKKKSRGIFPYNGKKNCFLDHIVFLV